MQTPVDHHSPHTYLSTCLPPCLNTYPAIKASRQLILPEVGPALGAGSQSMSKWITVEWIPPKKHVPRAALGMPRRRMDSRLCPAVRYFGTGSAAGVPPRNSKQIRPPPPRTMSAAYPWACAQTSWTKEWK